MEVREGGEQKKQKEICEIENMEKDGQNNF